MTISVTSNEYSVFGNKAIALADVAFDSSYPTGGESFDPETLFGLHDVSLALFESQQGYSFQYDYTNKKIKIFAPAPPIVYEEKQTPSSDIVTTNYPAAFFINATRTGNNKKFRSTGIALASLSDDEICLAEQMAAGERTQLTVKDYDRLAGDGAFTGGTTNWTFDAAPWTYGTNKLAKDADGTNTLTHDTFAAVIGRTYRLSYTISSWTVGTVTPTLGGVAGTAVGADGTYTEEITATTTDGLVFTPSNTSRFTIDSITVYDLSEPVYLTYVTQAWKDVWDNLVQDEEVAVATTETSLANAPMAIMYADRTSATAKALTLIDEDDTAASGEIAFYFSHAADNIKAVHADENNKTVKITYLKKPASGFLCDRQFENEGATKAGGDPYTNTFDYPILIWAYTGQVPINGGATQRLIDYAGTPAAGEAVIDWFTPGARGAGAPATGTVIGTKSDVTATGAGVWGTINEIQNLQPLEIKDGVDLSGISTRLMLIGV
ncbi:MAG: hypothetical protein LLG40_09870 [Deltaproteobacteria bacterium]|nr:hypothetical protein [Deltaproteobacteria bacterium]